MPSRFIRRLIGFVALFVLESGLAGSWLISTGRLLYPYGFWIYGSAGKVVLFSALVLALLLRDRLKKITLPAWERSQTIGVIASLMLLFPFFVAGRNLLGGYSIEDLVVAHLTLVGMVLIAGVACFPISFLKSFLRSYQKDIAIAVLIGIGFWIGMEKLITLWPYLSHIVLSSVVWLLSLTHGDVAILPPLTIQFSEFSVTIGQYCSGIESLLLLSALYILMCLLDRDRIIWARAIGLYLLLMIGMMGVNILRVYLIIQAGFWISPQMAAKFFHTYLGMILFLGYFLLCLALLYPKIMRS